MDDELLIFGDDLALMWTWWDDGSLVFGWLFRGDWIPIDPLHAGSAAWN